MSKANVLKILKILMLLIIFTVIWSGKVQASASVVASNCNVGDELNITVTIPENIVAYKGTLSIVYSDSSSEYLTTIAAQGSSWTGNYSSSSDGLHKTAKIAGGATVLVTDLRLYDLNSLNNISYDESTGKWSDYIPVETIPRLEAAITIADPNANSDDNNNSNNSDNSPTDTTVLNFTDVNETMYTTRRVNVRQNYGTDGSIIQTLAEGTEVTRTGISDGTKDGYEWSRISYNGITGYMITSALTDEAPVKDENSEENKPEEDKKDDNKEDNKEDENGLSEEDKAKVEAISKKLGAIPNVGVNIMPFIFLGSCVSCIVLMIYVKKELYNNIHG